MTSNSIPENWASINWDDDFDKYDVPQTDGQDLLMSLLEESQGEDCDDESLRSVIKSLEAEIEPVTMDGHDSFVRAEWGINLEDCQSWGHGETDSQDFSPPRDLEFNWMELDMEMEMVASSPCDEMTLTNWYMDPCGDEMHGIIEFGGVTNYSNTYYGIPIEENGYDSLWQETQDSVM